LIVHKLLEERDIELTEACLFAKATQNDLSGLCEASRHLRNKGKGTTISFSPKVFIPLTRLCRDFCDYCTFRQSPAEADSLFLSPEQVLDIAKAGQKLGCTEALFTLGERPELRYPEAKAWLQKRGFKSTLDYLAFVCSIVLKETTLLPHSNPGTMSRIEMSQLKEVNVSLGVMLETLSLKLTKPGQPHHKAPSKWPNVRRKTLDLAGRLKIPFTTGILTGIGESKIDRIEALWAIKQSNKTYGHIQEVIIQNFQAKKLTPMSNHPNPSIHDTLWTTAVARLILGPDINIQVPPNLNSNTYPLFLLAGINDWGGISPLTKDFVNPESPWPALDTLNQETAAYGLNLRPRLPIYPEYFMNRQDYVSASLRPNILRLVDMDGFVQGGINRYV
jgi:FO synthase